MIVGIQRVLESLEKYKKKDNPCSEMQTPPRQEVPVPSAPPRIKPKTRTVFVFNHCHYRQMEYVHWLILSHVDLARAAMITTNTLEGLQMIVRFEYHDRLVMSAMEQIIIRSEFEVVEKTMKDFDNFYYCNIK
jgi:hypothetical protein